MVATCRKCGKDFEETFHEDYIPNVYICDKCYEDGWRVETTLKKI